MKKKVLKKMAIFTAVMTMGLSSMTALAEGTYTTKAGDNLSKIAKEIYGDALKWREIYESNKSQIKDPNVIYSNQTLVIPGFNGETTLAPVEIPVETETPAGADITVTVPTNTTDEITTGVKNEKVVYDDDGMPVFKYTVTPMDKIMYVIEDTNIYEAPDYSIMGDKSTGTEVHVTGYVEEYNWYELEVDTSFTKNAYIEGTNLASSLEEVAEILKDRGYTQVSEYEWIDSYGWSMINYTLREQLIGW